MEQKLRTASSRKFTMGESVGTVVTRSRHCSGECSAEIFYAKNLTISSTVTHSTKTKILNEKKKEKSDFHPHVNDALSYMLKGGCQERKSRCRWKRGSLTLSGCTTSTALLYTFFTCSGVTRSAMLTGFHLVSPSHNTVCIVDSSARMFLSLPSIHSRI